MILAKAPMRVSFLGGGSDIPSHFEQWGGATISTAIDKFVYVTVNNTPHDHIKISYMKQELVHDIADIQNDIVRNALDYFGIKSHIEITSFADIPTVGTGLGGSSAFACALVSALAEYCDMDYNPYHIAETACTIEIDMCDWSIGKQDQYASAMGGMNFMQYRTNGRVSVTRMNPNGIHFGMLLIPTNIQRHASEVIGSIDMKEKTYYIRELALAAELNSPYPPTIHEYGRLLNEAWTIKRKLGGGVTNPDIDDMYDKCISNGALGAKLLGAGGGGYMLALTHDKDTLRSVFADRVCLDVNISQEGARVVYRD